MYTVDAIATSCGLRIVDGDGIVAAALKREGLTIATIGVSVPRLRLRNLLSGVRDEG